MPRHLQPVHVDAATAKVANAATVAGRTKSQSSFACVADDVYQIVVTAKAATLVLHAHKSVLVRRTGPEKNVIEHIHESTSCAPLNVAKRVVDKILSTLFHILLTNLSNCPARIPKRTTVAHVTDIQALITVTEAVSSKNNLELVRAVLYKPSRDGDTQMARHKNVEGRGYQNPKLDRKKNVQLLDNYAIYYGYFSSVADTF